MQNRGIILLIIFLIVSAPAAFGMAQEQFGPDSQIGHPTTEQPHWPAGIVELPRHPSRVYSMWCNGGETFYFKATAQQVNELIALFSAAYMRDHELWIKAGNADVKSFDKEQIDCNVSLNIVSGIALHFQREKNAADTFEPDLTIYAGNNPTWIRDLTIPDNIIVNSDIDGLPIKSKLTKPERTVWHGRIQYNEFPKPEDFISNVKASITLWPQDTERGYNVANVVRDGFFSLALSKQEYNDLLAEKSCLRITVGNWLTKPKKDHILFPVKELSITKDRVNPLLISRPELYYYGRILFEDGTPPILDPAPWPGAEINISFPYAGQILLDKQGCFKVFLTDDQVEALKLRKPRKNIYIPSYIKKNSATAEYIFPVTALTKDKNNPGTVKIPRPQIPTDKQEN